MFSNVLSTYCLMLLNNFNNKEYTNFLIIRIYYKLLIEYIIEKIKMN